MLGQRIASFDPFLEPPLVAYAIRPLLALPAAAGFAVYLLLSAAAVAGAAVLAWRSAGVRCFGRAGLGVLGLALLSLPAAWNYALGQTDALLVLPAMAALLLACRKHHVGAGLVLSLLLIKPQLLWLLPVALAASGMWRLLLGLAAGAAAQAAFTLAAIGFNGVGQWIELLTRRGPEVSTSIGIPGAVAGIGGNTAGYASAAVLGVAAAIVFLQLKPRLRGREDLLLGIAVCASLLLAPHVFAYDLVLLAVPLVVLARRRLGLALACAAVVNLAHLVDTYFVPTGLHLQTLALCLLLATLLSEAAGTAIAKPSAHAVQQPA